MTKAARKKVLEEQMRLLSERSKELSANCELADITTAMVKLSMEIRALED